MRKLLVVLLAMFTLSMVAAPRHRHHPPKPKKCFKKCHGKKFHKFPKHHRHHHRLAPRR